MGPSLPISLFAEPSKSSSRPTSYLVSAVVHTVLVGVILYGFLFAPRINMKDAADRYTLREVDINDPDLARRLQAGNSAMYPGKQSTAHSDAAHSLPSPASSAMSQIPKLHLADKTIVQPDIPITPVIMKHTPLPSLVLWNAQSPKVKLIAPPPTPKMANVDVKPVLTRPTPQPNISEIPIGPTPFPSKVQLPMAGSSTPVQVKGPDLAQRIPQTPSNLSTELSSGAVISISEEHIAQGTIMLPPANQTAAGDPNGALGKGDSGNSPQNGLGHSTNPGTQNGAQQSQGAQGNSAGPTGNQHGTNAANGANAGNGKSNNGPANAGSGGQGDEPGFSRVSLPPNGQYGVVVVGSQLTDQFPETAELWGGRLIYSVYLKVGLSKNWILQYSLPQNTPAPPPGTENHLEAPWPFYIVRPNEGISNVNADALMVHGYVTMSGRFESLDVVFPPSFRHAQTLVAALQQWQFRPAKHNGQAAKVEVLLIIPQDQD
jgi:hypothetical protein